MAKKNEITHPGRIVEITPDFTTVEITVSSACSSCHAKGLCGMSEEEDKVIMVPTDPYTLRYLIIEVSGEGKGKLSNIFVDNIGEAFFYEIPEIGNEYGSPFHRYLSVFSTLYTDFDEKMKNISKVFDVDTTSGPMLVKLAEWMGLELREDFLPEDKLRMLAKNAYWLNRKRGTKEAMERVCEIVLGEKVKILEKNVFEKNTQAETQTIYQDLYGNGNYDVTVLIPTPRQEELKSQLLFLLNQLKPIRCRLNLKFLEPQDTLDGHIYMDINAYVTDAQAALLDEKAGLDTNIILN